MSIANNRLTPHRTPKITRLPENRLQVERWFRVEAEVDIKGDTRLTARIFGGYGLLDGTAPSSFGKTEFPNSAFADCRLIEEQVDEERVGESGAKVPILYQKYQTLTSAWALEDEDKPSAAKNGLRVLTRSEVASPGTAVPWDEDDVGELITLHYDGGTVAFTVGLVVTGGTSGAVGTVRKIVGDATSGTLYMDTVTGTFANDEALTDTSTGAAVADGKGLYLAAFDDDSDDRRGRMLTRWAEAGTLEVSKSVAGVNAVYTSYVYLAVEPASTKSVIRRTEGDYQGLKTISVTYLEEPGGDTLVGSSKTFDDELTWTLPGTIDIDTQTISQTEYSEVTDTHFVYTSPLTKSWKVSVTVSYSTTSTMAAGDKAWAPDGWVRTIYYGHGRYGRAFAHPRTWNGYLLKPGGTASVEVSGVTATIIKSIMGNRIFGGTTGYIKIENTGTSMPTGSTVIASSNKPAFEDLDGNTIYKKTVVTAVLPS